MHGNGHGELAQLRAEVAELRAAVRIASDHLAASWRPRLLDLERDVDVILETLAAGGDVAGALHDYLTECRRARTRATEGDDAC